MNTPNPALMRLYGTHEVFFKKASSNHRVADEVAEKVASELVSVVKGEVTLEKVGTHLGAVMAKAARAAVAPVPRLPVPHAAPGVVMPKKPLPAPPGASAPGHLAPPVNYRGEMKPVGPLPKVMAPPKAPVQAAAPAAAAVSESAAPAAKGKLVGSLREGAGKALEALRPGWKTKATLLGAGALGVYGVGKALGAAKDIAEAAVSAGNPGYGYSPGGYYPPMGVNAHGYPQIGTPLM